MSRAAPAFTLTFSGKWLSRAQHHLKRDSFNRSLAVHMAPDLYSAPFAQLLSEVAMPTRSIRSCAVFEKNEIEYHRGRLELVRLPGRVPKLSTRIFGPITVSSSQDVSLTPCSKTRFLSNFSAADSWRFHITARAHRGRWC